MIVTTFFFVDAAIWPAHRTVKSQCLWYVRLTSVAENWKIFLLWHSIERAMRSYTKMRLKRTVTFLRFVIYMTSIRRGCIATLCFRLSFFDRFFLFWRQPKRRRQRNEKSYEENVEKSDVRKAKSNEKSEKRLHWNGNSHCGRRTKIENKIKIFIHSFIHFFFM